MAKGYTTLQIVHPNEDFQLPGGNNRARNLNAVMNIINGILSGARGFPGTTVSVGQSAGTRATGTLTFSSASGTVGGSINGVAITVTAAGGDTNAAALWVAAVAASTNPLVQGLVTASSVGGVATVQAVAHGLSGNAITLAASGTGVTASGARLTGGVSTNLTLLVR